MTPQERELRRVQAAIKAQRIADGLEDEPEPPIISVPADRRGNGKRWWNEVWSKVVAGLLLALAIVLATGAWDKGKLGYLATTEVYSLPDKVKDHESRIRTMELKSLAPMPAEQVKDLARALALELEKQPKKKETPH